MLIYLTGTITQVAKKNQRARSTHSFIRTRALFLLG